MDTIASFSFSSIHPLKSSIHLDSTQTSAFLAEKIDVYAQYKYTEGILDQNPSIISVDFIVAAPMSREAFLRMYLVWYANTILGARIKAEDPMAPSDANVSTALDVINTLIHTAEDFEDAYLDYAFSTDSTDLGFYAKDNELPTFAKVRE